MIFIRLLLGLFTGFILFSLTASLCELLVGLMMKYEFLYYRVNGVHIKRENGSLRLGIWANQLNCHCEMYKRGESKKETAVNNILPCVLSIAVLAAGFGIYKLSGDRRFVMHDCIIGALFYTGAHLIVNIGIVREFLTTRDGRLLWEKNVAAADMLTGDKRPRDYEIYPQQPEMKRYGGFRLKHLLCEYYHYLDMGEYEKLLPYYEIFDKNTPQFNSYAYLPFIYEVIFYGAFVERDTSIHGLFKEVETVLTADKTVFAKRVYAYYLYYLVNNKQKACEIAKEGIEAAEKYEFKGLAEMEKMLLTALLCAEDNKEEREENEK